MGHGSPAPAATQSPAPRSGAGAAHLWVPRGLGNPGLLLGLVCDGARWPDAPTFTARALACSRDSARRWADELVRLGLAERSAGWLVATAAGRERLRRCDPLPRRLLRPGVADRTPALLRAASVLYGETIGPRASRHGVRGDRERADLAGVHRSTIRGARSLLASVGVVTFGEVRRGRAVLVRAAPLTKDGTPIGSHGRPVGAATRNAVAEAAARRRGTAARTSRVTAAGTGSPIVLPTGETPMQGPAAPATEGSQKRASLQDGWPAAARRRTPASASQVLGALLPDLPAAKADRSAQAASSSAKAAAELRRLARDSAAVARLLRMPQAKAVEQVLAAAQVLDRAPKRRAGLALQVARVLDSAQVLALALDVVLGRPRNVGAVMLGRLKRAIAGTGELLTRCRASWPIGRFVEALADGEHQRDPVAPARRPAVTNPQHAADLPPALRSFGDLLAAVGLGDLAGRATA